MNSADEEVDPSHYMGTLDALLRDLDHLEWKRSNASTFSVPYKTLLSVLERDDLIRALDRRVSNPEELQKAVKKLLRDSAENFQLQLRSEIDGAPFKLIPVLRFYDQCCRGVKRGRLPEQEGKATVSPIVLPPVKPVKPTLPDLKLFSIPGAHWSVRMSPEFGDGQTMLTWLYEMLLSEPRCTLDDIQVGSWLLRSAGGGVSGNGLTPRIVAKLLRLAVTCAERPRVMVFDPTRLCLNVPCLARYCPSGQIVSRARLVTLITLQWSKLKKLDSTFFGELTKAQLMRDVTMHEHDLTADEWCTVTRSVEPPEKVVLTTEFLYQHVAPWLFMLPEWLLAFAVNALGLRYPGRRPPPPQGSFANVREVCKFLNIGLMHKSCVVVPSEDLHLSIIRGHTRSSIRLLFLQTEDENQSLWRGLLSGEEVAKVDGLLIERYLPTDVLAAQQFIRTKRAPPGLSFDEKGIFLSRLPHIRLEFRWYQLTASAIDVEQLFRDAYQILIGVAGPRTLMPGGETCSFGAVVSKFGLLGAMLRVVDIARRDHTYPDNVVPIFDMNYVPVCDQAAAFNIHRLTGRFSKHITGFRNNIYDIQWMLTDVCTVLRRTGLIDPNRLSAATVEANPWITPGMERYFSPKDVCLLLSSVFATVELSSTVVRPMLDTLQVPLRRTDVEDMENTIVPPVMSVDRLYSIASESHISDARESVCGFLEHYRVTEAPFVVYETAIANKLDELRTHAVLCGKLGANVWFDGNKPRELLVSVDERAYRSWIGRQSRSRERLVPHVPCPIRIRYTGEEAVLVSFDYDKDCWTVWKKNAAERRGLFVELARRDFDLLDQIRCLPAPVKLIGDDAVIETEPVAVREDSSGGGVYWIEFTGGAQRKMRLSHDFVWASDAYRELDYAITLEAEEEEDDDGPQLISQLFDEDGEKRYRILQSDMPLPGPQCQDWVMKEFFSETGRFGVWHFVRWMEMKVSTTVLYEAFYAVQPSADQPLNESWAQRATQQIKDSCRWLWERIQASHSEHFKVANYQRMVWFTKMSGRTHDEDTFAWLMEKLYDL